jgi:hypothetical protein
VATDEGRTFREAWIAGVNKHFPGTPKDSYVSPWDQTPEWEREAAAAVYRQVVDFIRVSEGKTSRLSREQRARFIATCWIAQIYKHHKDPKPAYVADYGDLPPWQQDTDADIFDAIEKYDGIGKSA